MGGAIATIIAAERNDVAALVLLAPYFTMPPRIERLTRWPRLFSLLSPYVRDRSSISIWDPIARAQSLGFGVTPVRTLPELLRVTRMAWEAAPRVRTPTLMLHSSGDNRISVADAERGFAHLGASERRFVRLDGCGHVIAVDSCKEIVFAETVRWLEQWMSRG
jgi:alpha-beta hydrolase superfamily lysophospholipase